MTIRLLARAAVALAAATWLASVPLLAALRQPSGSANTQPASDHDTLARAYAALAAGKAEEARRLADTLLARSPRDHAAAAIVIEVASNESSAAGLDAYESWLAASRHEDAFLLEPVAYATARALGSSASGDERARQLLAGATGPERAAEQAEERGREFVRRLSDPESNKIRALQDLSRSGYRDAAAAVVPLLRDPSPDVRAMAAETLGTLGATDAVAALQAMLKDPASEARAAAAAALHRLGDPTGDELLGQLLTSGVPDIQLQAAGAMAEDPPSAWAPYVEPLLAAEAPMTRLHAARLLMPVRPEQAAPVLERLLADPNPVVVGEMARTLTDAGLEDLATIRQLLRHPSPEARLQGATALLRLTGAVR